MKKLLAILLVLLLSVLLVACVGPQNDLTPDPEDKPTGENGEVGLKPGTSFAPDAALVDAARDYLYTLMMDYDLGPISISTKLDFAKWGARVLLTDVSPDDYYFLAAYCADGHDKYDVGHACTEQAWLGFTSADSIPEKYDGMDILAAFQVNRATTYRDIATDTAVDSPAGMFTLIDTAFVDGYNTTSPLTRSDVRVHFISDEQTSLYYTLRHPLSGVRSSDARLIDGEYYILQPFDLYVEQKRVARVDLMDEYGDYYYHLCTLTDFFNTAYRELDELGNGMSYGLIKPADIFTVLNAPEYDSPYDDADIETTLTPADLDGLRMPAYLLPLTMSSFPFLDFSVTDGIITVDDVLVGELTLIDNPSFDYAEGTLQNITFPGYGDDYTEFIDHATIRKVIRTAEKCYVINPIDDPACTSDVPVYLFRMGDELFAFRTTDGQITILYRVALAHVGITDINQPPID